MELSGAVRRAFDESGEVPSGRIEIVPPQNLSYAEFAACYSDVHCTVRPSLFEGFGLIPMQSIACATPVIAPCGTGLADYITRDNAMVLRNKGVSPAAHVYYDCGSHPAIDEDHLVELMRHAVANWEREYHRVQGVSDAFRARHSWSRALAPLLELLDALVANPGPEAAQAVIRRHLAP